MEIHRRGFRLQRGQCVLASAVLGTATMVAVLVAALLGAPESTFVGICLGGLGAMLTAAFIGQLVR